MRCPKCSCEVGSQSVCPFCGATVYVGNSTWGVQDYARQTTVPVSAARIPPESRQSERSIKSLEMKVNLLLVLQSGTFALAILALLIMALK